MRTITIHLDEQSSTCQSEAIGYLATVGYEEYDNVCITPIRGLSLEALYMNYGKDDYHVQAIWHPETLTWSYYSQGAI